MQETIKITGRDRVVVFKYTPIDAEVDLDGLTRIDHSNLYGEAVTVSALLNKVGLLASEAEALLAEEKLSFDVYVSNLKKVIRSDAVRTSSKINNDQVEEYVMIDEGVQILKRNIIKREKELRDVNSVYWAIQSKDKKLSVLMKGTTPEEFVDKIIEGSVNTLLIKKTARLPGMTS